MARHPRLLRQIIWMLVVMVAANCSPAVACRRAKCDGDIRVTLMGAQPPYNAVCVSPTRHENVEMGLGPDGGGE
jgi:hypothetical protein